MPSIPYGPVKVMQRIDAESFPECYPAGFSDWGCRCGHLPFLPPYATKCVFVVKGLVGHSESAFSATLAVLAEGTTLGSRCTFIVHRELSRNQATRGWRRRLDCRYGAKWSAAISTGDGRSLTAAARELSVAGALTPGGPGRSRRCRSGGRRAGCRGGRPPGPGGF